MLALTLLHSATITGSIYSYETFEKVNGTVLRFEGPQAAQVISPDGDYTVQLVEGEYNLTALHMENGSVKYFAKERLDVGPGNQTYDVVLFDPGWFEGELPDLGMEVPAQQKQDWTPFLALAVLIVIAIAAYLYLRGRTPKPAAEDEPLGEDESGVLRILAENEGRIEQKRLREILGHSESKMSLLLTELEVTGKIKRFRKGRENIIKLKKEA